MGPYYLLQLPDGQFAGVPLTTRTRDPQEAAAFGGRGEARDAARQVIGAEVVEYRAMDRGRLRPVAHVPGNRPHIGKLD